VGDFDGDCISDILLSHAGMFFGNGDGTFKNPDQQLSLNNVFGAKQGDFNNDTKPDLLYRDFTGGMQIAFGGGKGLFNSSSGVWPVRMATNNDGWGIGDINMDGILDIVFSYTEGAYSYVASALGIGQYGEFSYGPVIGATATSVRFVSDWTPVIGDINADGYPDVVAPMAYQQGTPYVGVMLSNGPGSHVYSQGLIPEFPTVISKLILADFNGDGRKDIIRSNKWVHPYEGYDKEEILQVYLADAQGKFPAQPTDFVKFPIIFTSATRKMVSADFNGDGRADIALVHVGVKGMTVFLSGGPFTCAGWTL
jgi:hypothetical protein